MVDNRGEYCFWASHQTDSGKCGEGAGRRGYGDGKPDKVPQILSQAIVRQYAAAGGDCPCLCDKTRFASDGRTLWTVGSEPEISFGGRTDQALGAAQNNRYLYHPQH